MTEYKECPCGKCDRHDGAYCENREEEKLCDLCGDPECPEPMLLNSLDWDVSPVEKTFLAKPSDRQVNGDHYKSMAIQPSEFIYRNTLDWYEGNAVKYICRHRRKGGRVDVEKAIHYLELLLEAEYAKSAES